MVRTWSPDIVAIGDRVARLSRADADTLGRYLAAVHHLVAARVTAIEVEPDVIVEAVKTEPTTYSVVLEGVAPTRRISAIRAIRDLLGVGLREALGLVDATPSVLRDHLEQSGAESLKAQLEAAGASVSLRPA
jgi:large subunit ribosomal protein L7/L12